MFLIFVYCLSAFMQVIAAVLAFRLIRLSGKTAAWFCVTVAMILMAFRRLIMLEDVVSGWSSFMADDLVNAVMTLGTSSLLLFGVHRVRGLFLELAQSKEDLRKSEKTARVLLNQPMTLSVLLDARGRVIDVNQTTCDRLSVSKESMLGSLIWSYFSESQSILRRPVFERVVKTGMSERIETPGYTGVFEVVLTPISGRDGTVERVAVFCYDVSERKRTEEKLRDSLKEKEVLLLEVHHRVKNNLQMISGLLQLKSGDAKQDETRMALEEMDRRVQGIGLIHQMLYQSKDLLAIDFHKYLNKLFDTLSTSCRVSDSMVTFDVDAHGVNLSLDQAVPCALVAFELVWNSLKHAFPMGSEGVVRVRMTRSENGDYELMIHDDGKGLPEHVDITNSDSLGLRLARLMVEHDLRGSIESELNDGTTFTVRFPAESKHVEGKVA